MTADPSAAVLALSLPEPPGLADLLAAAAILPHLDDLAVRLPEHAPAWLAAHAETVAPPGAAPRTVLAVGSAGPAGSAGSAGALPVVHVADGGPAAASPPGSVVVCVTETPRIVSKAASGRGTKTVGPLLPPRRACRAGRSLVLLPCEGLTAALRRGVAEAAARHGLDHVEVDPERDDPIAAIAAASVVCGPPQGPPADWAGLWDRPYLVPQAAGDTAGRWPLPAGSEEAGTDQAADPDTEPGPPRDLMRDLAALGLRVLPGRARALKEQWPGAGPRIARQVRQALFAPF